MEIPVKTKSSIFVVALCLASLSAPAQITTGTISGRVVDSSGASIPGAKVTLVSEVRGIRTGPVETNTSGDYVFANVTADTYSSPSCVSPSAPGWKLSCSTRVGTFSRQSRFELRRISPGD
jgi:hypothetical protein